MMKMMDNKKAFSWLQIVIVLAIFVLVVYGIFNLFLPQITAAARLLGIPPSEDKPSVEYTVATLETHKGLIESYLARVGSEIDVEIVLNGEIHRTGFIGETCLVCTDYVFETRERIPFIQLTRGTKTQRVEAAHIVGGADEGNLDGVDAGTVEMSVELVQRGYVKGSTRETSDTWSVLMAMVDEQGNPMHDETGKQLRLMLLTVSDVQVRGRDITYQVRPSYEYDEEKENEQTENEQTNENKETQEVFP